MNIHEIREFDAFDSYERAALASPGVMRIIGPPSDKQISTSNKKRRNAMLTWLIELPCVPKSLLESALGGVGVVDELIEVIGRVQRWQSVCSFGAERFNASVGYFDDRRERNSWRIAVGATIREGSLDGGETRGQKSGRQ